MIIDFAGLTPAMLDYCCASNYTDVATLFFYDACKCGNYTRAKFIVQSRNYGIVLRQIQGGEEKRA